MFLKENQSAPRPSEHPPVMGGKMSKRFIQACQAAGVKIPKFCHHDKLFIAGNCTTYQYGRFAINSQLQSSSRKLRVLHAGLQRQDAFLPL